VVQVANASRFGSIYLDTFGRVTEFSEKQSEGPTLVNGGVYMFSREVFDAILPTMGRGSLEREIFPALIPRGVYGMPIEGYFVDIGVPEEYNRLLRDARSWVEALGIESAGKDKC
jgi:NDP-sugar pyrophosphorylase family protein